MNVRKPVNYSVMFATLDMLIAAALPQMELYCEIGRVVSGRPEKGTAAVISEYLQKTYPDISGTSPRNLRRMREFFRAYGNDPKMLAEAMTISWTQNVVILEADLTLQERLWYIQAARQFSWSKLVLLEKIKSGAHLEVSLDFQDEVCYTEENNTEMEHKRNAKYTVYLLRDYFRQPSLPSVPPQVDQARHRLYRQNGPPVSEQCT